MLKIKRKLFVNVLILLFISISVLADNTGTIIGSVYSPTTIYISNNNFKKEIIGKGDFVLKNIPTGKYTISFTHIDFENEVFNIIVKEGKTLDLGKIEPVPKKGVIEGLITSEDGVLENVKIILKEEDILVKTDKQGKFRIENLRHTYDREPYQLLIKKEGYKDIIIKKNVGINRLTLLKKNLNPSIFKITGKAIPGSSLNIKNKNIDVDDNGYFEFEITLNNENTLNIEHQEYKNRELNIKPSKNKEINLGVIKQNLKRYEMTTFEEDSSIGAYFLKDDLKNNYYPFLNIKLNNIDNEKAEEIIKSIISNYILVQDLNIINEIKKSNINKVNELYELFSKSIKNNNDDDILKELLLLNQIKNEIDNLYSKLISIVDNYNYRFYHINLIKEKETIQKTEEEQNIMKIYKEHIKMYSNKFAEIEDELNDSKKTTKIINNMIPLNYDDVLEYKNSPLISIFEKNETKNLKDFITIKKVEPRVKRINENNIEQIVSFFNIFNNSLIESLSKEYKDKFNNIDLKNWYKWREFNYEK